jgi:hypothetical protein
MKFWIPLPGKMWSLTEVSAEDEGNLEWLMKEGCNED